MSIFSSTIQNFRLVFLSLVFLISNTLFIQAKNRTRNYVLDESRQSVLMSSGYTEKKFTGLGMIWGRC